MNADNFFAENITFENDYHRTHAISRKARRRWRSCVTGDRAVFHNVRLLGNQDTSMPAATAAKRVKLNCKPARQFFTDCYIAGNVDFIFGDGKTVFKNCEIHSTPYDGGYITAQSKHYPGEDSGFVLDNAS